MPFRWPARFFNKKIGYMAQADESLERVRPSFEAAVAEAAAAGAEGGCREIVKSAAFSPVICLVGELLCVASTCALCGLQVNPKVWVCCHVYSG